MHRALALAGLAVAALAVPLPGQQPAVALGFGVDTAQTAWSETSWHQAVPGIVRAWSAYLGATPGTPAADTLWSAAERKAWPAYDLTLATGRQGFPATILDVQPVRPGSGDVYQVKTLFAAASGAEHEVRAVALTRVFAVRENGRWAFGNALPRLTATWPRRRVGQITFVYPPDHRFDSLRARRAVAFADSLATAFRVARPPAFTYYLADGPEQLFRAMGIDWSFGGQGYGYAIRADDLLLSGDPSFGEENRHELTHYVLSPLLQRGRVPPLAGEGLASWLGGSVGLRYEQMMREYAVYLADRPQITLDSVLAPTPVDLGERPAGAMLAAMVAEHAGVAGLKALLVAGPTADDLRTTVSRLLGMPWPAVDAEWRRRILAFRAAATAEEGHHAARAPRGSRP